MAATLTIADQIDLEFSKWWREQANWDVLLTDDMRDIAALAYKAGREQGQRDTKEMLIDRLRSMKQERDEAVRVRSDLSEKIQVINDILRR